MWSVLCLIVAVAGLEAKDISVEEYRKFPKLYQLDEHDACLSSPAALYCLGTFRLSPLRQDDALFHNMLYWVPVEEYRKFPKLYQLDEHDACLSSPAALYCLGTFRLSPLRQDDALFHNMLEYSKDKLHFNRTLLHRGYCVSARCRRDQPRDRNATRWFERCVDRSARARGLRAHVLTVKYCTTGRQSTTELDAAKLVFLFVVFCILLMNAVGTYYDLTMPDDAKKNKLLIAWSWRANWRRLTALYEDGDPRLTALTPIQGVRVFVLMLVICMHCGLIHFMLYSYNPHYLETIIKHPVFMLVRNGTSLVQVFVMMSSFLLAYNLLLHTRGQPLAASVLPRCLLNRLARITPVYLLVVGFAATWWPALRGGPMWYAVEEESRFCRQKFWAHALYINNFVQPDDHCLVQTWFLAVDMQLFVVSSVLTLVVSRWGRAAVPALAGMFLLACLANGLFAYLYQWRTMLYIMNPENLRTLYRGERLFTQIYLMPWACLPAALLGLLLAYLHFHLEESGFKFSSHKWLVRLYHGSIPLLLWLVLAGLAAQHWRTEPALAAYVALERPVFGLLAALCLLGMFHGIHNPMRSFFSWRCWHMLARASLAALMLHWGTHLTLAASTPQPLAASCWHIIWDWLATAFLTYLVAVPLTVLVELPVQRTVVALMS